MRLESSHCTEFGGSVFEMHPSGALYWPAQSSLLVGDLHFEKASSYHKTGQFLPPYDTHQTLQKLEAVIECFKPSRIFFLGDTMHWNPGTGYVKPGKGFEHKVFMVPPDWTTFEMKAKMIINRHEKKTSIRVLNPMFQKFKSCKYLGNFTVQ